MKLFLLIIFCLFSISLFADDSKYLKSNNKLNIPSTDFLKKGFSITIKGGSGFLDNPGRFRRNNFVIFRNSPTYFITAMDSFSFLNDDNYLYYSEKKFKRFLIPNISFAYNFLDSKFSVELSSRGGNLTNNFLAGDFSKVNTGNSQLNLREGQLNLIKNEAINKYFMVRPLIGVRVFRSNYERNGIELSNLETISQNYLEQSFNSYAQQSGLIIVLKLTDSISMNLKSKIFFSNNGRLESTKRIYQNLNTNPTLIYQKVGYTNIYFGGYENEIETVFSNGAIDFLFGGNFTYYEKEGSNTKYFPQYFTTNRTTFETGYQVFLLNKFISEVEGNATRKENLKYFYFGVSLKF